MQGRRLAHAIEKYLIGVSVFQSEFQMTLKRLAERARTIENGKQVGSRPNAQGAEDVVTVTVALVNRRRGGTGGLGHRAHGKGLRAAARPQPRRGAENALFQIGIRMPGHFTPPGYANNNLNCV